MKDLYTFDVDEEKALESYEEVCSAYDSIFSRIGVEFVKGRLEFEFLWWRVKCCNSAGEYLYACITTFTYSFKKPSKYKL